MLSGDDWEGFSASRAMVLPPIRPDYGVENQRETTLERSV